MMKKKHKRLALLVGGWMLLGPAGASLGDAAPQGGKLFDPKSGATGWYKDFHGVWWSIVNRANAASPTGTYYDTIIFSANPYGVKPPWQSGTVSTPQDAIDFIDAFAIRNAPKPFPWLLLVLAYAVTRKR